MITYDPQPVLFSFFGFEIRYYGLFYVLGFLIVYFMFSHFYQKRGLGKKEDALELLFWGLVGGLIFARIFYILFYNLPYYISNPMQIFAIWNGGLSFHGGLVGAVLFVYLYCRHKSIPFLEVADLIVIPASLALALGRVGNFLNGELYGRVTMVPWAIRFTTDPLMLPRHPSQLYEAGKNLLIFFILFAYYKKKYIHDVERRKGSLFILFVLLYGILRFFVEFFRAPDEQLGLLWLNLSMGQWLSISMIIFALIFNFVLHKSKQSNKLKG